MKILNGTAKNRVVPYDRINYSKKTETFVDLVYYGTHKPLILTYL